MADPAAMIMPKVMEEFDSKLARANIRGQWKSEGFLQAAIGGPKPAGTPQIWRWADTEALLDEAGRVMPESLQARRSLIYHNPDLARGTTHTINAGVQMIQPGETAWAHRHSIAALRFVIQGDAELATVVDGERCPMEDNDLVLTPNWSWHDHHNGAARPGYWLDALDVGLVLALNQPFYEPGREEAQPPADATRRRSMRYRWRDTEPALHAAPLLPHDGKLFAYVAPGGGPTLPTLSCQMQLLPKGFSTAPRRRTSSAVIFIVSGRGEIEIGGKRLAFGPRDTLALPNWSWHRLIASEELLLLSVSDAPALQALGLYREELN